MVKRTGGARRKTRHKFKRHYKEKGKISITRYFQELKEGEKVILKACPAYQKGLYFRRFHGRVAEVIGKQGNCYKVSLRDGQKEKTLLVHPVHLKLIK